MFTQSFTSSVLLWTVSLIFAYLYGTITLYGLSFQTVLIHLASNIVVLQPQYCRNNTGLD